MFGLDQLRLEVLGDEIIVILPATSYGVTYYKPTDSPHLLVKNFLLKIDRAAPMTQEEFLARAWQVANEKAARARVDRRFRTMTINNDGLIYDVTGPLNEQVIEVRRLDSTNEKGRRRGGGNRAALRRRRP